MKLIKSNEVQQFDSELSFGIRAASTLGISVIADALDYVGAPIFALPVIGDITDLIVTGLLYRITKSKVTVAINAIEFIPFIGDFIPTYTISTLLWIFNESRKKHNRDQPIRGKGQSPEWQQRSSQRDNLRTRIIRASTILRTGHVA
jgi:hypothetical protein